MAYKLIVFDWDGTLVDSIGHLVETIKKSLHEVGFPIPDDNYIRQGIGLSFEKSLYRIYNEISDEQIKVIGNVFYKHWCEIAKDNLALFPKVFEFLSQLKQDGYLLAIATSKRRQGFNKDLASFGLEDLITASRCGDEAFSKPHPQMLEEIMGELMVDRHQVLMVGDTEYDIQLATNAGVDAVGVSYGAHNKKTLLAHRIKGCVDKINELADYL